MHDILDLDRFPLDRPEGAAWQALVDRCRAALDADGMFNLDGLLRPDAARSEVARLLGPFQTESFRHERDHNIYFSDDVPGLAAGHPALTRCRTSNFTLCADQVAGGAVTRLYEWPPLVRFLAAAMDKPELHVMDDPLARENVMAYHEGQALNWHFDRAEFTTTLLLQAPDAGGAFEYRTGLRSDTDPNHDGVARLLRGEDPQVRRLAPDPGTLNVFRGRNTAHRVTPVQGARARIIAVLSFFERPGVAFSDAERIGFYGRAS